MVCHKLWFSQSKSISGAWLWYTLIELCKAKVQVSCFSNTRIWGMYFSQILFHTVLRSNMFVCEPLRSSLNVRIPHISWGWYTRLLKATLGEKQGKDQRDSKEQEAQGLKEDTRSLRHHGLVPFHLFFSPCKGYHDNE